MTGFLRVLRAALRENAFDIIHIHSPHLGMLYLWARLFTRLKHRASTVYTVHSSYPNYKSRNRFMLILPFALFDKIVCCSNSSLDSLPRFLKRLASDRLCAVQNGVDLERVDRTLKNRPGPKAGEVFYVTAVGRLEAVKNPFAMLASVQRSRDRALRLTFVGPGHLTESLIRKSQELGVEDQVVFAGLATREKVYEYLARAHLFISTSWVEGLPIAVLEAMACACPVLLSDIPSHREIAASVDFIPLVQPSDTAGFAREIHRFRRLSAAERADIGQRCRQLVQQQFSLAAMLQGYREVYDQLLRAQSLR